MKVPKLRFVGFIEDWRKRKLNEVASYSNGGSYENDVKPFGKYQLVTLKSVDMAGKLVNSGKYIDKEVPTLNKDTLVMILSEQAPGLLGMTAQIPENNKYVLNQRVAEIRPQNNTNSYFLSMAINRCQQYFSKRGAGTKVQNISKGNVENFEFYCPTLEEQQKIGYFFKQLDKKIQLQQEKINLLKEQKKGYMQKIFNGVNSLPQKTYSLDQLGEFYKGHTLSKKDLTAEGLLCVLYGQLYTEYNEVINTVKYKTSNNNGFQGLKGDLLIPSSGETAIDIARVASLQENALLGGDLSVLRVNPNIADSDYLSYQINFKYKHNLAKLAQGASVVHLYTSEIKKLVIQLPTLEHQYKVSRFLSAIDQKIQLENTKRIFLLSQKQAFIQQMFI